MRSRSRRSCHSGECMPCMLCIMPHVAPHHGSSRTCAPLHLQRPPAPPLTTHAAPNSSHAPAAMPAHCSLMESGGEGCARSDATCLSAPQPSVAAPPDSKTHKRNPTVGGHRATCVFAGMDKGTSLLLSANHAPPAPRRLLSRGSQCWAASCIVGSVCMQL